VAAELVLRRLGGGVATVVDVRGGGHRDGAFDCLLELPDRSSVCLEVTRSTDPASEAKWAAVSDRDWQLPGLSSSWAVMTHRSATINALGTELVGVLNEIEAAGITEFGIDGRVTTAHGPTLSRLGVQAARRVEAPGPPRVVIAEVGPAVSVSVDDVLQAVLLSAERKARTLARAPAASAKHLFVWVDVFSKAAWTGMASTVSTFPAIALPDIIDVVWVCRTDETHLWMIDREGVHVIRPEP
jgi:hypothetical protein